MTAVAARPLEATVRPQAWLDRLVLGYALLWIVFLIGGFRMPWEPIPLDEDVTYSTRRQLVFTFGALLGLHRLVQRGHLSERIALHMPWVAMAGLLCGSLIWTTDVTLTAKRSLVHLFGVLTLLSVVDAREQPLRFYLRGVVHVIGLCAWISLVQEQVWPADCWSIPARPGLAGLAGHPNVLGPSLLVGVLLSLARRPSTFGEAIVLRVLQAGMLIALWRTDSMTSITTSIAATGLWIALTASSSRAGLIQFSLVFAAFVRVAVGADELRSAFFAATGRDESFSGRNELWRLVYDEARARPLLGTGFGAFWYIDRGIELVLTWNPKQAHHAWIDVIAEIGFLGFAAVIVLVPLRLLPMWQRCAGRRGSEQRDAVAAIVAMTVALLSLSAFSESFLLRMDKLQWFVPVWGLLLLENRGRNRIELEFAGEAPPQ